MTEKEFTTIQIYREDLQKVVSLCKKNENLRDKLHQMVKEYKKNDR